MKYNSVFYYAIVTILSLLFFHAAQGQETQPIINASLAGIVVDAASKSPIESATVQLAGVTHQVKTDKQGRFQFVTGQKLPFTVTVSYVGYLTQSLVISTSPTTIELKASSEGLEEIVVVGYTTLVKKNAIGAVDQIAGQSIKDIPAGSFDEQLQGKVAGVQIAANTGVPGEALNIRLRGATSIHANNNPLYVIDGVFMNGESLQILNTGGKATSAIADINPSDIESIDILKDAEATALYGSRGANGVILVTTKRGKQGQSAKIDLNINSGAAKVIKLWELTTGEEHAQLVNEYFKNRGQEPPFRAQAAGGRGLPEEQQTYDRLSEAFRTASLFNADISLYGGSEKTSYYMSGGFNRQESILKPIAFNRGSFRVNLDQKVHEKLKIGTSNLLSRTFRNQGRAGDGPQGGILQAALHSPTYLSPYNEDGVLVGRAGFDNLTLLLDNYAVSSTSIRYIGNLYGEYQILPSLRFRSTISLDYNNYNEAEYWNSLLIAGSPAGLATSAISQSTTWINEQTLTYRKKIEEHSFGILVGNTLQGSTYALTSATGRGFASNSFKLIGSAASTTSSQDWDQYNLASFFGRVDYNFNDSYLLDVSIRADGSSKFSPSQQWGYFPAVGFAWRLKNESFFADKTWLSDLKIRTSYGSTGNQNGIHSFASRKLWTGINASYQNIAGISPLQLANENLSWEKTSQFNIGVDASFWNNALSFTVNYYSKYTKDGLLTSISPGTTGFETFIANAAEISNTGFEVLLNSQNIRSPNFTWTSSLNIASNVNKIEKLARSMNFGSRDLILFQEGSPMYSFWLYKQLYVDPQTGDAVYEDVNGDGAITTEDRQILGSIWPSYFGGFTNNFRYKNFDLQTFLSFSVGNKIYNHNRFFGDGGGARDAARVIFASNLARWEKPGDLTDVPRADGVNVNNYRDGGGRWLEDGSYLRLKTFNIGYTVLKVNAPKLPFDKLRIYAQATNLFLWTTYSGLDPESAASSEANQQGIDLGTPPQPRSFQLGVNVTF